MDRDLTLRRRSRSQRLLRNRKGQTMVEYLMLLVLTFVVTFFMMQGPFGQFATYAITTVRTGLYNAVRYGEYSADIPSPGQANHPGNPARAEALH